MTAAVPTPSPADQLEHLSEAAAAELLRLGEADLADAAERFGAAARTELEDCVRRVAKLAARKALGDRVDNELAFARGELKRFAALGALIIGRGARSLVQDGFILAGEYGPEVGKILGGFARGLALGAIPGAGAIVGAIEKALEP